MDKALHVINYESGGNPKAAGDGGVARGLFQIQDNRNIAGRPDAAFLDDPENNIKYAAETLGAASGNWAPWGENNLYQGKAFGALGNHPYQGAANARVPVGGAIQQTQRAPQQAPKEPGTVDYSKAIKKFPSVGSWGATKTTPKSRFSGYSPVGRFADDVQGYFASSEQAWQALAEYQRSSPNLIQIDENQGIVLRVIPGETDIDGNPAVEIDEEGTRMLQEAMNASKALDRLYSAKTAGIYDAGESAALAYLNSERAKSDEATRKYEDMTRRVGDIVALEDIPVERASKIASTLNAINSANSNRASRFSTMGTAPKIPKPTDLSSVIQGIKDTLPGQVPGFRPMAPDSLEPMPSASSTYTPVPFPSPEEVLQKYGIQDQGPAVPAGIGSGAQPVTQPTSTAGDSYLGPRYDPNMMQQILESSRNSGASRFIR